MHPTQLIGQHLDRQFLKSTIHKIETICAFTGEKIEEGILLKDLISSNFTDNDYIKYNSKYASIDVALCMQESYVATRTQVMINKGEYKSYEIPLVVKLIDTVWFYFNSSNLQEVESLLKHLKGIGKKNSTGYGLIESHSIEETNDIDFTTSILRPIPKEALTEEQQKVEYIEAYCGYQPPYWDGRNMTLCAIPI